MGFVEQGAGGRRKDESVCKLELGFKVTRILGFPHPSPY
jgi:hypothetical protein